MKNLLVLALALVLLVPLTQRVFAAPAATRVPEPLTPLSFKGTMQSTETYSNVFPNLSVAATGSGDATQIG